MRRICTHNGTYAARTLSASRASLFRIPIPPSRAAPPAQSPEPRSRAVVGLLPQRRTTATSTAVALPPNTAAGSRKPGWARRGAISDRRDGAPRLQQCRGRGRLAGQGELSVEHARAATASSSESGLLPGWSIGGDLKFKRRAVQKNENLKVLAALRDNGDRRSRVKFRVELFAVVRKLNMYDNILYKNLAVLRCALCAPQSC
jgi:hypothetical protein